MFYFNIIITTNQIEKYLGESLNSANLILEQQQATSIVLKAKSESKSYKSEVKLTWNLKLFEITNQGLTSSTDISVHQGIKLFIYLNHKDNLVKTFDYASFKNSITVIGWDFSFLEFIIFNVLIVKELKNHLIFILKI